MNILRTIQLGQSAIIYAEIQQTNNDWLVARAARQAGHQTSPDDHSWIQAFRNSQSPRVPDFHVQNAVCAHCRPFIMSLMDRMIEAVDTKIVSDSEGRALYGIHPQRNINSVIESAALGCWLCSRLTRHAERNDSGRIMASFATLYAFTFSLDRFTIAAGGVHLEDRHWYATDAKLTAVDPPAAGHRVFDLKADGADLLWRPDGLSKARNWLQKCEAEHQECRNETHSVTLAQYPSRLLDVSNSRLGCLRLVNGLSVPSGANYAALSHCWGNIRQGILTKTNLEEYTERISLDSLPKSFVDAVEICNDLGIPYLWIDSMCIIQEGDNKTDWLAEAPRMQDVYRNAYITIAATASRSDSGGLLRPLDRSLVSPLIFKVTSGDGTVTQYFKIEEELNFEIYVNDAPLNERSWVIQERALSRRILHFANDQIYWQCSALVDAQFDIQINPLDSIIRKPSTSLMQWGSPKTTTHEPDESKPEPLHQLIPHGEKDEHFLLNKWDEIVQAYSLCQITFTSDKLIAISGIAKHIQTLTQWPDSDYLAGVWKRSLPRRLLWQCVEPSALPPNDDIPSWSWAHINGEVFWPPTIWTNKDNDTKAMAVMLSASTTPVNTSFGSVKGGSIKLAGLLCLLDLQRSVWEDWYYTGMILLQGKWVDIPGSKTDPPFTAEFDLESSRRYVLGRKVFFMPIVGKVCTSTANTESEEGGDRVLFGLLLEPTKAKNGQFRRVGWMEIENDVYAFILQSLFSTRLKENYYIENNGDEMYVVEII